MSRTAIPAMCRATMLIVTLVLASCTETRDPAAPAIRGMYTTPTGLQSPNPPQILVGAGDIASCTNDNDEATAKLLDNIAGTVMAIGDNAYDNGSAKDYKNCYDPTWGRHKVRTRPSTGNHEYNSNGATPYFDYFGAAAGTPGQGYYSYDLGAWHVIVLNSSIATDAGSPQDNWLKADVAAHPNLCTLAYFHHPLYSSTSGTGSGGATYAGVRRFWDDLYPAGVDLVLGGHRHFYERMAPMKPDGGGDNAFGIREIIAGTGGMSGGDQTNVYPLSEARNGTTFGVLKLYLYDDSYAWKFVPVAGKTFTDSGSTACHGVPGSGGGGGGVSGSNSTVTAAAATITAGGSSTITVTAKDANGNPVTGASVVLSATGSGNTLTQPSATSNASGVATGSLSSTVAEPKTVTATISGVSVTQTATIAVTAGPPSASQSTVSANPTTIAASSGATTITVAVRDAYSNPVSGSTVTLAATGGGNTLSQPGGSTNASGVATGTLGSTVAETKTVSATANGVAITQTAAVTVTSAAVSAAQSTVTAAPGSIVAGGAPSTITVTARDANGNPVSGATVVLAATGSGNTLSQPTGPTDASGVATGSLASTVVEAKTVTTTIAGVPVTQTASIAVTAGPPSASQSSLSAAPSSITASSGVATITVTVRDAYNNPVSGATVTLAATGSGNTLAQPAGASDGTGQASGTLSSAVAETKTVSAVANGTAITQVAVVTVTPAGGSGGITHTLLTSGNDPNNVKIYTTASISPAPNTLITIAVLGHNATAASADPTVTGGGMATWDKVVSLTFDAVGTPHKRLAIFRAMSASPGSGPITITFPSTESNSQWIVSQWSGVDVSGTNGSGAIGQTGVSIADAVSGLTATLAAFGNSRNVAYGVVGTNAAGVSITPGSGFTEIAEQSSGESARAVLEGEWATNDLTVDASWATLVNAALLAVEIKAAP